MDKPLLDVNAARDRIVEVVGRLPADRVPLEAARGLVLAEPIKADVDFPPFERALMDGFAVRTADLPGALEVVGQIAAGQTSDLQIAAGQAARIMTGAPLPGGADAVIPLEQASSQGDAVTIPQPAPPGQFIMARAGEARRGAVVLEAGVRLGPAQLAVAAAVGAVRPQVHPAPSVAVLATGDELVPIDTKPGPAQIRNSNCYNLKAQAEQMGCTVISLGTVGDDRDKLGAALRSGLEHDVLLVSGGASVGAYDFVPELLTELGARTVVRNVAVRPGKPLLFGIHKKSYVFALPGNPVSTFVCFVVFVAPVLRKLMGRSEPFEPRVSARLSRPMKAEASRETYYPALARHERTSGNWSVAPVHWVGSGDLFGLAAANALLVRPAQAAAAEAGDSVNIILLAAIT